MAGFNSPSIMFLNTWDKPERDWNHMLFRQALRNGYTRYVELYAGAFSNVMVAVDAGWEPEQIETCDVWLYTAALGYAYANLDHNDLGVCEDGRKLALPDDPLLAAAKILATQYRLRIKKHDNVDYMRQLLDDLEYSERQHQTDMLNRITDNNTMRNNLSRLLDTGPVGLNSPALLI